MESHLDALILLTNVDSVIGGININDLNGNDSIVDLIVTTHILALASTKAFSSYEP